MIRDACSLRQKKPVADTFCSRWALRRTICVSPHGGRPRARSKGGRRCSCVTAARETRSHDWRLSSGCRAAFGGRIDARSGRDARCPLVRCPAASRCDTTIAAGAFPCSRYDAGRSTAQHPSSAFDAPFDDISSRRTSEPRRECGGGARESRHRRRGSGVDNSIPPSFASSSPAVRRGDARDAVGARNAVCAAARGSPSNRVSSGGEHAPR